VDQLVLLDQRELKVYLHKHHLLLYATKVLRVHPVHQVYLENLVQSKVARALSTYRVLLDTVEKKEDRETRDNVEIQVQMDPRERLDPLVPRERKEKLDL